MTEDDFEFDDFSENDRHSDEYDDEFGEGGVSKSQIKREMQALRDLGKNLIELPSSKLAKFPISERLYDAIVQAQTFKMKALKRQIQHIGVLMRGEDVEAIRTMLDTQTEQQKRLNREFHQLEDWRTALIEGDQAILNEVINIYPDLDRQRLMQLIRNAKKEAELKKPAKSSRAIFVYLRELHEQENNI